MTKDNISPQCEDYNKSHETHQSSSQCLSEPRRLLPVVSQVLGVPINSGDPTHILDILSPFHKEVSLHQESDHGSCWYQEDIFRWWFIKYMFLFPLKM